MSKAWIGLFPEYEEACNIAVPDGVDPQDIHITLLYMGETDIALTDLLHRLKVFAASREQYTGKVTGSGKFYNSNAMFAIPGVPGLNKLAYDVRRNFPSGSEFDFVPHITLKFGIGKFEYITNQKLTFKDIILVHDKNRYPIPFKG